MSGDHVKVDPDRMRAVAPRFQETAHELSAATAALASSLSAEGECWGADEPGENFAKGYVPGIDSTMKAMADMSTAIAAITDKLHAAATNYQQTDDNFGQQIDGQL